MTKTMFHEESLMMELYYFGGDADAAQIFLDELLELKRGEIKYRSSGICSNTGGEDLIRIISEYWDNFSFDPDYPIQPDPDENPQDTYESYVNKDMWDKSTEYGKLRYELLDFLIEVMEEYINVWLKRGENV